MTSSISSARAVLVYALILPLALIMGYLLASPTELGTWATVVMVLLVLSAPLILANHHAVLFLSWNMTAVIFFLPGRPQAWLILSFVSLFIALFQRALSKDMRFISVPSLFWPLLWLAVVVSFTAYVNGGFGLRVLGGESVGGRRYVTIFASVAGFLAMCAQRIPSDKVSRYAGMYFLGSLPNALGSLVPFLGPSSYFLLMVFPFEAWTLSSGGFREEIVRYYGLSLACLGVFFYLLARYGAEELMSFRRPLRLLLMLVVVVLASGGGFRSDFAFLLLTFFTVFCLEGLLRTKYFALLFGGAIIACLAVVPLAKKLPLPMQRTLSFLPIDINPIARFDAEGSTEWRVQMWQTVLPQVPEHLWLGKGLGISAGELELASEMSRRGRVSSQEVAILASDYHNGLLSVIIPFGIWGMIGILWFWICAFRALYRNYKYTDPALRRLNTFLLALFIDRVFAFVFVYGSFYDDLAIFTGIVGLSVAVNHGIRAPVPVQAAAKVASMGDETPLGLAPALARST